MKEKRFKKVIENQWTLYYSIFLAIIMAIPTYMSYFDLKEIYGFAGGFFWGVFLTLSWLIIGLIIYFFIKDRETYWVEIK